MSGSANILLIRLRSMGDIMFTLPAVHLVRESLPGATITFLVSKEYAPLLEGFQDVNTVIAVDRARFRRCNPKDIITETLSVLRQVRRGKFSLAVDFHGHGETGLLAWCSGAPQRAGLVYHANRDWAYTKVLRPDHRLHPAERNLSLLRECGLCPTRIRNEFTLPASALAEAGQFLGALGLSPAKPVLFIQPFTSTPSKSWRLDRFLEVAHSWRSHGWQVIFGGGPADLVALEPARQAAFPVSAGMPLMVTAGLIKLSTLVLGNDTGILHLAVAMGKRVIMLLGSAEPGSCHPFQHPNWSVVPPEGQPISSILTNTVNDACARALKDVSVV